MMHSTAGRIETHDVVEHQSVAEPWDVILRQMSPGQFHARIDAVQVNGIFLYREHWSQRVVANGATPQGYFMLGDSSSPTAQLSWCGEGLNGRFLACGRSSSEVDFVTPETSDHVVLLAPEDLLQQHPDEESRAIALSDDRHHLKTNGGFDREFPRIISRLVGKYVAHPEALADPRVCKAIESQLLGNLARLLTSPSTDAKQLRAPQRRKALRRALEYVDSLGTPPTVPELAASIGVSQRTLNLVFNETIGIPPVKCLRWCRMGRLHQDLLAAEPDSGSVTEIALRHGFTELGRLAVEYKRVFGESPSRTLSCTGQPSSGRLVDFLRSRDHS